MEETNFHILDYIIFFGILCISAIIGLYFGCFGNKQKTANEYLYGNKNMKAIPVGLSLYSSAISTITILGTPTEIYTFGFQYFIIAFGAMLSLIITWNFMLPVFCGSLEIQTPYEYFEQRFNSNVRLLSSFIYIIHTLLFMPVVLLAISLALSQSTGTSLIAWSTIIGGICVFYTMLGGYKSVIWTDSFQAILMLFSTIFILIMGFNKIGSASEIWRRAELGQRTQFDMDPNPFKRLTFWSAIIGSFFYFSSHSGCAASSLQRYMSLQNHNDGKICTFIGILGVFTILILASSIGLIMYALYYNCDPIADQKIKNPNQLISLFISDVVGDIPGFSGLFYAGILSAGLSTISAELNTVSGLVFYDFIQKNVKKKFTEKQGAFMMKIIVLVNGSMYLIITPAIQNFPHISQLAVIIAGVTYGTKLGIMLLGTTFPKANSIGTLSGALISVIFMSWIGIASQINDISASYALPLYTINCTNIKNVTVDNIVEQTTSYEDPFIFYKLSMFYYPLVGTLLTVSFGMIISYFTGFTDIRKIDNRLLIPCMRPAQQQSVN